MAWSSCRPDRPTRQGQDHLTTACTHNPRIRRLALDRLHVCSATACLGSSDRAGGWPQMPPARDVRPNQSIVLPMIDDGDRAPFERSRLAASTAQHHVGPCSWSAECSAPCATAASKTSAARLLTPGHIFVHAVSESARHPGDGPRVCRGLMYLATVRAGNLMPILRVRVGLFFDPRADSQRQSAA